MRTLTKDLQRVSFLLFLFILTSCTSADKKQADKSESFSFIFLTDIHLEPGRHAPEGFQMAIDRVNELAPDFVLTGGDLIADALGVGEARADSLYQLYKEMATGFRMPVYNTMGNHEVFGIYAKSGVSPDDPLYGERMFEKQIGKRYYAFEHKGWRFYVLDGIEEDPERFYYGGVDSAQMAWIREDLASVPADQPLIISTHIPLMSVQSQVKGGALSPNPKGLVVGNSKEVLELFKDHNLKLVLQGHLHFLEDIYAEGIHFITGGAVSSAWWTGKRDGLEEGFLKVNVKGETFDWEYIDYGWVVPEKSEE